jgi:hypothetical protein
MFNNKIFNYIINKNFRILCFFVENKKMRDLCYTRIYYIYIISYKMKYAFTHIYNMNLYVKKNIYILLNIQMIGKIHTH